MADWIGKNAYLSWEEMENNAPLVWAELDSYGFSFEAVIAILGNMTKESTINPGLWESQKYDPDHLSGYGLVQWTPASKYINWAGADWENNGPKECERINWDFEYGDQWQNKWNPMTATEFKVSTEDFRELTKIFLHNYERPTVADKAEEDLRISYAEKWYEFLSGMVPPIPTIRGKKKNWWIYGRTGGI